MESTKKVSIEDEKPLIWTGDQTPEGICHRKKDLFLQHNVENEAINDTASKETESEAYHHSKSRLQHKLLNNSLSKGIVLHLPSLLL